MSNIPTVILVIICLFGLGVGVFLLDHLLLWMERKGWIYYRSFEPKVLSGARGIMGTFQEIVQPEIRQVKEEQEQRTVLIDGESGQAGPNPRPTRFSGEPE